MRTVNYIRKHGIKDYNMKEPNFLVITVFANQNHVCLYILYLIKTKKEKKKWSCMYIATVDCYCMLKGIAYTKKFNERGFWNW